MADRINLLPDNIANQIAAGEVIQRPASVVKELLENAVDAESSSIKLVIKDAGKTLIQVVDDGCGMSETDLRMSMERHATSKIHAIDDLFAVRTMGFRGEALASIAAVAQVEVKTRRKGDELGTHMVVEGSEVKSQEPCNCPEGTIISVKNLFFNVPARRNFLKSNPVETRHIIEEFQRVALAYQEIFFTLHHNSVEVFHLPAANLRQRVTGIFGKKHNQNIVPVEESTDILTINGFVGKPESAKKTRGDQYFFINQRFIKNPYLNHAVFNAYEDLLPKDSYPFFVLFIDIDPKRIDINVHPTKQEIKFDDEKVVYSFVRAAVKHGLGQYSVTPSLDFDQEAHINKVTQFSNAFSQASQAAPTQEEKQVKGGTAPGGTPSMPREEQQRQKANLKRWEDLYEAARNEEDNKLTVQTEWDSQQLPGEDEEHEQEERQPYQLHNRYIVTQIKSGMIMVDQQAAHERILYEEFFQVLQQNEQVSQQQLFPQTIELSPSDAELLNEIIGEINAFGYEIQPFGQNSFVVHGVPSDVGDGNEQATIETLLENYKSNLSVLKMEKREGLARSLAQNASIPAGKPLGTQEMRSLIDRLFACQVPYTAPNGRLTFITFDLPDLEKRFEQKGE